MVRTVAFASVVTLSFLAGCLSGTQDLEAASTDPLGLLRTTIGLLDEGGYTVEQPLDVYLVGFPAGTGERLQGVLKPEKVHHVPFSFTRNFPPDPNAPSDVVYPNPAIPTAVYRVHEVDAAVASAFLAEAAGMKVEGADGILDANLAEARLAAVLREAGYTLDPNRPAFVILHGGDVLGEHAWRYTYSHGHLQPVRTFGEREPILVTDVSAEPDPYVVGSPYSLNARVFGYKPWGKAYDQPVEADGAETVEVLRELTVDATHYRFLKGPIYPISTKPCHHVTLILAVHTTSLTQYAPGFRSPEEWVDVEGLTASFMNVTGDPVHVELKVMKQPQDDPVLDALARGAGFFVGPSAPGLDAMRWYIDENFEKFVTPMDGCEEYLSLLIFGDAAQQGMFGGIGMYDVEKSHRISFSLVPDTSRLMDPSGELRSQLGQASPSRYEPNWVNLLYAHEVGHTLGQHHPQHLWQAEGDSEEINSFESVWSVMSYQTGDRIHDFGLNDKAQWQRNRLGYAIAEAQLAGKVGTPEFEAASMHAGMFHWDTAYDQLLPILETMEPHEHPTGSWLHDYDIHDSHEHPNWVELWREDGLVE